MFTVTMLSSAFQRSEKALVSALVEMYVQATGLQGVEVAVSDDHSGFGRV